MLQQKIPQTAGKLHCSGFRRLACLSGTEEEDAVLLFIVDIAAYKVGFKQFVPHIGHYHPGQK